VDHGVSAKACMRGRDVIYRVMRVIGVGLSECADPPADARCTRMTRPQFEVDLLRRYIVQIQAPTADFRYWTS
jgi:hypothetical protein